MVLVKLLLNVEAAGARYAAMSLTDGAIQMAISWATGELARL